MGILDKILGGQGSDTTTLDKQEAFAAILLMTVSIDGDISDEEVESVIAISNRMQLLRNQTAGEFNSMIRKLRGLLQKHGASWLLAKAAERLPVELRQTAFAISADLVFADGTVEPGEKKLLESIQVAMGIPDDLALKIVEVLQIKNRG